LKSKPEFQNIDARKIHGLKQDTGKWLKATQTTWRARNTTARTDPKLCDALSLRRDRRAQVEAVSFEENLR
jgi:hypothetical protein